MSSDEMCANFMKPQGVAVSAWSGGPPWPPRFVRAGRNSYLVATVKFSPEMVLAVPSNTVGSLLMETRSMPGLNTL